MKIVTYSSYGGNMPDAILDFMKKNNLRDIRSDEKLIKFIESFAGNEVWDGSPDKQLQTNTLWPSPDNEKRKNSNGPIKYTEYAGWATDGIVPFVGLVTVNEFDETAVKTVISEYDGAECLDVLPEFVPVDGIPGLYEKRR